MAPRIGGRFRPPTPSPSSEDGGTVVPPALWGSPGALDGLRMSPQLATFLQQQTGRKDIWGSTWSDFMGILPDGSQVSEYNDTPSDRNRAIRADAIVQKCDRIRGDAVASVPLRMWQPGSRSTNPKRLDDHPALMLLKTTNPLGYVAGSQLLAYILSSKTMHGHAAIKVVYSDAAKTKPAELYFMQPEQYTVISDPGTFFGGILVRDNRRPQYVIPPNQLIYMANRNLADPLNGISVLSGIKNALNLRTYSQFYNYTWFKNNARPDWILTGSFSPTEENVGLMKRLVKRWLGGDSPRGPLILPADMKATLLTASMKDAEFVAMLKIALEEICAGFGVPLPVYGNLDRATYDNITTAFTHFWLTTMVPEMDQIAEALTVNYLWRFWPQTKAAGQWLAFDYTQVEALNEDVGRIYERFTAFMAQMNTALQRRAITPNNWRQSIHDAVKLMGMSGKPFKGGVDGGDTFYARVQEVPIKEASAQLNVDIMAARAGITDGQVHKSGGGSWQMPPPPPPTPTPAAPTPPSSTPSTQNMEPVGPVETSLPAAPGIKTRRPDPNLIRRLRAAPIAERGTRKLKKYFQAQQAQAMRSLRNRKADAPDIDPSSLWDHGLAVQGAIDITTDLVVKSGIAAYQSASDDFGLGVTWKNDNGFVSRHMGRRLPLIQGIDDTTTQAIQDTLNNGTDAGESIPQLAARVSAVFRDAIDNRAETIARTEVINAYGQASIDAYREAGVEMVQMYDGSFDPECAAMDGDVVDPDTAEKLMSEEHPNGTRGVSPFFLSSVGDVAA